MDNVKHNVDHFWMVTIAKTIPYLKNVYETKIFVRVKNRVQILDFPRFSYRGKVKRLLTISCPYNSIDSIETRNLKILFLIKSVKN